MISKYLPPGCSLEGLMLRLKLQYFGHLVRKVDSLEKTVMLGGIGGRRRRGWQRMRWLDGITDWWKWVWVNSRNWWWTGRPGVLRFMGSQRVGHDWATELNWINLFIWLSHAACGILVPQAGIKTLSPALESWNLNHSPTREVPRHFIFKPQIVLRFCGKKKKNL